MLIIDAHLDLALNALQLNRDLLVSAHTIRTHELGTPGKGRAKATTALPDMRRGRVALSIVTAVAKASGHPKPHLDFRSATQTYAIAQGHLAYYRALEEEGHLRSKKRGTCGWSATGPASMKVGRPGSAGRPAAPTAPHPPSA
jgi:membrane dipeptidase